MKPMPLSVFETVSSTQDVAEDFLKGGIVPPFAIFAHAQEKGRGQMGRSWVSPQGTLALSVVLKCPFELLSLKIGVLVCQWLRGCLGVGARIKWPNDLLFGEVKLGGILCETTLQREPHQEGIVTVGIGLNVRHSTHESFQERNLRRISLERICKKGSELEPLRLAESLVNFISQQNEFLTTCQAHRVLALYQSHALPDGSVWRKGSEFFFQEDITSQGALRVSSALERSRKEDSFSSQDLSFVSSLDLGSLWLVLLQDRSLSCGRIEFSFGMSPRLRALKQWSDFEEAAKEGFWQEVQEGLPKIHYVSLSPHSVTSWLETLPFQLAAFPIPFLSHRSLPRDISASLLELAMCFLGTGDELEH